MLVQGYRPSKLGLRLTDVKPLATRCARYVPDRVSPGGDSRSLAGRRTKELQISVSAGRPWIVDETSQADSAGSIPSPAAVDNRSALAACCPIRHQVFGLAPVAAAKWLPLCLSGWPLPAQVAAQPSRHPGRQRIWHCPAAANAPHDHAARAIRTAGCRIGYPSPATGWK
jgi:hypothetical protein